LLALWDAEEDGLLGSKAYVASPRIPIADTVAYINMDIIGANPVQGFRRNVFVVGVDTSPQFLDLLDSVAADLREGLVPRGLGAIFGQGRSDYQPFLDAGVPTLFLSDTTGGCYHTPGDDLAVVHIGKALRTAWIVYRIVQEIGFNPIRPTFSSPNALPTYRDAITLKGAFLDGLCDAEASGLTPADVTQVGGWIDQLDAILTAGPAAFDSADAITVGTSALDAVDLLTSLRCQAN
jgi:hypothetical protein